MSAIKTTAEFTASRFSSLVGADRHEIQKKLAEIKAKPTGTRNGGKVYGLRDLVMAYAGGDERAARVRKLKAESERLEIQNARSRGELIEIAQVKRLGQKITGAIQTKLMSFPLTEDEQDKCLKDLLQLRDLDFS